MPQHLIPVHALYNLAFAVDALAHVSGLLVLSEAVSAPLGLLLQTLLVKVTQPDIKWVLAQIAELVNSLIRILWLGVLLLSAVKGEVLRE